MPLPVPLSVPLLLLMPLSLPLSLRLSVPLLMFMLMPLSLSLSLLLAQPSCMPNKPSLRNIATAERRRQTRPLRCTRILNGSSTVGMHVLMQVPEASMKEWRRRGVYSGVQAASICRGMRQGEVAYLFNQACICVRAYNSTTGDVPPQDHAALGNQDVEGPAENQLMSAPHMLIVNRLTVFTSYVRGV